MVVSSKDTSPAPNTSQDSNTSQEEEENNILSETKYTQQSPCHTTLHGLKTRGARTFLINQRGIELDCMKNYKGEQ